MARSVLSRRLASISEEVSWLRYLGWFFDGPVILAFWGVCGLLPPAAASRLGAALVGFLGPRSHKQKHVLANLATALRDTPEQERRRIAKRIWRGLGMVMAEYPHMARIAHERMRIEMTPAAAAVFASGKRAIFVTAHVGNWEISAHALMSSGARLAAIYSPLSNPLVDWAMRRYRGVFPCEYMPKDNAMRTWLRKGEDGPSLALMVDQRGEGGDMLPFFGEPCETVTTPARLAARYGVPLVPFRVTREGDARYTVRFEDPVPRPAEGDAALGMMAALTARFEAWIVERPHEWMCTKRRWPKPGKSKRERQEEAKAKAAEDAAARAAAGDAARDVPR